MPSWFTFFSHLCWRDKAITYKLPFNLFNYSSYRIWKMQYLREKPVVLKWHYLEWSWNGRSPDSHRPPKCREKAGRNGQLQQRLIQYFSWRRRLCNLCRYVLSSHPRRNSETFLLQIKGIYFCRIKTCTRSM